MIPMWCRYSFARLAARNSQRLNSNRNMIGTCLGSTSSFNDMQIERRDLRMSKSACELELLPSKLQLSRTRMHAMLTADFQ